MFPLLLPKRHYFRFTECDDDEVAHARPDL